MALSQTSAPALACSSGSISIYVGGHAALNGTAIDDDDDMEGRGDMGGMGMGDMAGMGMGDMGGMDGDGNDDDAGMRAQVISADIPFNVRHAHLVM